MKLDELIEGDGGARGTGRKPKGAVDEGWTDKTAEAEKLADGGF